MPHKPSQGNPNKVQFVSASLTVEMKHQLADWALDNKEGLLAIMVDTVQSGYRVCVKEEDEGYSASAACVRLQGPNKGLVLVERASTPERALLRLLWVHRQLYKMVWPRSKESPEDDW